MSVLTRGARARRGSRRPGWVLFTALLVLAVVASSALVFTNRVELLKLAVILALWAAVVAAFVSVIYRRQSDIDQAKARDLKLVYDLQLDREISARREYELTLETQLRRELASELRAQAADEISSLRAELSALRTNLEILFETDLAHRPALETERTTVRAYSDWARDSETTGRVSSSRIGVDDGPNARTEESPIIDVAAEPQPSEYEWAAPPEPEPARDSEPGRRRRRYIDDDEQPSRAEEPAREQPARVRGAAPAGVQAAWPTPPTGQPRPPSPPEPEPEPEPEPQFPWLPPPQQQPQQPKPQQPKPQQPQPWQPQPWRAEPSPPQHPTPQQQPEPPRQPEPVRSDAASAGWQPAPAEGLWVPAGTPGSNWVAPVAPGEPQPEEPEEYVGRRRAPEPTLSTPEQPEQPEPPRGRHSAPPDAVDPGRPSPPPVTQPSTPEPPEPQTSDEPDVRHRGADETDEDDGAHTDGQSVADLLARFRSGSVSEGGGRRRREE